MVPERIVVDGPMNRIRYNIELNVRTPKKPPAQYLYQVR